MITKVEALIGTWAEAVLIGDYFSEGELLLLSVSV